MSKEYDKPINDYLKIKIEIDGDYKLGIGWTTSQKTKFETELYPAFIDAGYSIVPDKLIVGCPHLKKKGSRMDVYMHPMEFTGYVTDEELKEIVKILGQSSCIYKISVKSEKVFNTDEIKY